MATDNFDRADGGLGANWTTPANAAALAIASTFCTGTASTDSFGFNNTGTQTDAQSSAFLITDGGNSDHAPAVRMQNGGANGPKCYLWSLFHSGTGDVMKLLDGFADFSVLASHGTFPWADTDVGKLEIDEDGTMHCLKNDVQQGADVTDGGTVITGGRYGIFNFGNVSKLDDWVGAFTGANPSAALTGTATASITEADIVTGGKTIIITLTDDTWLTVGALFDAVRQDIIDGIDSAQSEGTGWDTEVKAKQGVAGVVRTSDTVVTITLDAQAAYNITVQETITVTVPISATVTSLSPIIATPTFVVTAVGGFVPGGDRAHHKGMQTLLTM